MHAFVIQKADYVQSPDVLTIQTESSIGIEEVRQIQKFLSKKPIQEKYNAVYILNAHLLTVPAQNALLKTLEEPPGNSQIYLVTSQPDLLLPTVLSRVQVLTEEKSQISDPQNLKRVQEILNSQSGKPPGERIAIVDSINMTREQSLDFLNQLEHLLHQNLSIRINYEAIVNARKYLKANVNVKLVLDKLFFDLCFD
jgi:hypothetical protein